jgi:murein DD-endopeptidase MepM/ murein hydrolase activator NlpD
MLARAGVVALLALGAFGGFAMSSSGRAGEQPAEETVPRSDRPKVVDLTDASYPSVRAEAPVEKVSEDELASIERKIKARTSGDAATPADGISPGAPSDKQVRAELRQLKQAQNAVPAGPIRRGAGDLIWSINGAFTSPFGQRWGRLHAGIDLAAPTGTPIRAAASGQVILMAPTGGYGNYTCINHGNSLSTCYAHQSRFATSQGAVVRQGQVIGYVGNTGHSFGAHLHFEVRINGQPVDPMEYL